MADSGNAKSLKIFGGEMAQFFSADVILAECRLVSFKTERSQPVRDVHRRSLAQSGRWRPSMAPSTPTCPG